MYLFHAHSHFLPLCQFPFQKEKEGKRASDKIGSLRQSVTIPIESVLNPVFAIITSAIKPIMTTKIRLVIHTSHPCLTLLDNNAILKTDNIVGFYLNIKMGRKLC